MPSSTEKHLQSEALAVGALHFGGICFVSADLDGIQCTIVVILAVVCTLGDGALNCLVRGTTTIRHNATS